MKTLIAIMGIASASLFSTVTEKLDNSRADLIMESDTTKIERPKSLVNYDYFEKLVAEVKMHREARMLNLEDFKNKSKELNTIILDTRSKDMFDRKHIKGAIHLNFANFDVWSLASIVPNKNTQILIYCNNNFWIKPSPEREIEKITDIKEIIEPVFVSKSTMPENDLNFILNEEPENAESLALNIPTYINLYGYGYKNVYELADLVDVNDPRIEFEGTDVID